MEVHVAPVSGGTMGSGTLTIEESIDGGTTYEAVNKNAEGDDLSITTLGGYGVRIGQGWATSSGTDGRSKLLQFKLTGSTTPDIKVTWRPSS